MKIFKSSYMFIALLILFISQPLYSQTNVIGITGITFTETDTAYSLQITDDFKLHGMSAVPGTLTLSWNPGMKKFSIYGSLDVTIENKKISAQLGNSDIPGLVVIDGAIQSVNMGVSGPFDIYDIHFIDDNVNITWQSSDDTYLFTGSSKININSDTVNVSFGDASNAGVTVSSGNVTALNLKIDSDFDLFGSSFEPKSLSLHWLSSTNEYGISGEAQLKFNNDSLDVKLGTDTIPGILIQNSILKDMDLTVSGGFELYNLDFISSGLHISYDSQDKEYIFYGSASLDLEGSGADVSMGSKEIPGIRIENNFLNELNIGITGQFSLRHISFHPQGLTFEYSKNDALYKFYGKTDIVVEKDIISVDMGTVDNAGMEYQGKKITKINTSLTAKFTLRELEFHPVDLTFQYSDTTSSYEIFGSCSVAIGTADKIDVGLGNPGSPGIKITDGNLVHINFGLTADFKLKTLDFTPKTLTFVWDKAEDNYKIHGSATAALEGNKIEVVMGDTSNPGIVIDNGDLDTLNMSVSTDFKLRKMEFKPNPLHIFYESVNSEYIFYGDALVKIDNNFIDVHLGDSIQPGIVFSNGSLISINLKVTSASIDMYDLKFQTKDLSIALNAAKSILSEEFVFYGSASLDLEGSGAEVLMGTQDLPGLRIENNVLTALNIGITGKFSLKDISFHPQGLTFEYSESDSLYKFYGNTNIVVEKDTINVDMGTAENAGMEYKDKKITKINTSLTAKFTLKELLFHPVGLTFQYSDAASSYEIFGSCSVAIGSESITVDLGNPGSPGIKITGGNLVHINFGLTADFKLKKLDFHPTDLTFVWDKAGDYYKISGSAAAYLEGDKLEVDLGDTSKPGIVIKNGDLDSLNISVSEHFELKALKIIVNKLTLNWTGAENYKIYGDIKLDIDGDLIEANLGTTSNPGLTVAGGVITNLNIGVTSDIKIGGLEAKVKNLTIVYHGADKVYYLSGKVSVNILAELDADLPDKGIQIDTGGDKDKLIVNNLIIEIKHADLGTIDLNDLKLKFDSSGITESDLNVTFPMGWEVKASMLFSSGTPKKVTDISIDFSAVSIEEAIEIPETGISIIDINGNLNITNPSDLTFHGSIGLVFGGPFNLDHKSAAFVHMTESTTITSKELILGSKVELGAYKSGDKWESLLGDGSVKATLVWSDYYRFKFDINVPTSPLVEIDGLFNVNKHKDLDGLLDVGFHVPHWVPFIGGKKFGSVDGALRYKNGSLHSSYAAAWLNYKTFGFFGKTHHIGAKYEFGNRKVSKIGSGTIDDIKHDIKHDLGKANLLKGSNASFTKIIKSFDITENEPELLMINLNWGSIVDTAQVVVLGPDGIYDIAEIIPLADTLVGNSLELNIKENTNTVINDSAKSFYLYSQEFKDESPNLRNTLTPGNYQLIFSYDDSKNDVDSLNISVFKFYPEITGTLTASVESPGLYNLELDYWTYLNDSVKISFYWNDTTDYTRGRFLASEFETAEGENNFIKANLKAAPEHLRDGKDIYFYAVIDDGTNTPYYTPFTEVIKHHPLLFGKVSLKENQNLTPWGGLHVYVDSSKDGSFNTISTGGIEKAAVTDSNGVYVFNSGLVDSSFINVVIPVGYELDEASPNALPYIYIKGGFTPYIQFYIKKSGANNE